MIVLLLVEALHIYYSSFLIAFVASGEIKLPFNDLDGFIKNKRDYVLGLEKDSYIEAELKVSNKSQMYSDDYFSYVTD